MADERPGSYARSIDPDGSIKGPDLTAAFDRASTPERAAEIPDQAAPARPVFGSQQVAGTNLAPRAPAPASAYDRAKATEHREKMWADDKSAKAQHIVARARLFAKQDAAQKDKAKSLGRSFGQDQERDRGGYER